MPKVPPRIGFDGIKEENIPCVLDAFQTMDGAYWVKLRGGWRIPDPRYKYRYSVVAAKSVEEVNEYLSRAEKIPRKKRESSKEE